MPQLRKKDLIYPDLCYQIMGVLFDIWLEMGPGHKENFYQKARLEDWKLRNSTLRNNYQQRYIIRIN